MFIVVIYYILQRCIEQVKISPYINLAHDLEIQKAIVYLKAKNFTMAIETLKDFEKRDVKVASSAATNLSFLYFLVGFDFRLKFNN